MKNLFIILPLMAMFSTTQAEIFTEKGLKQAQKNYAADVQWQEILAKTMARVNAVFIGEYTGECRKGPGHSINWYENIFTSHEVLKTDTNPTSPDQSIWFVSTVSPCRLILDCGGSYSDRECMT